MRRRSQTVRSVCVYCGSGHGDNPIYAEAARALGGALAEAGIGLVYGGGGLGLMGEVARATLDGGGKVTGIIPEFLVNAEHALKEATELIITSNMHERKMHMFERSDAFVALPGGIGTLEEFVEQLTWNQIGQHTKPIVLANVDGYWDPLVHLLTHMERHLFIRDGLRLNCQIVNDIGAVIPTLIDAAETTSHSLDIGESDTRF